MTGSHSPVDSYLVASTDGGIAFPDSSHGTADSARTRWFANLDPDSQASYQSALDVCLANGKSQVILPRYELFVVFQRVPGSGSPSLAAAFQSEHDNRSKLLKRLAKSLSTSKLAIKAIPFPCCYQDASLRYLGCNQAFESFFAVKEAELIGKLTNEAFGLAGSHEAKANRAVQLSREPLKYETVVLDSFAQLREVEIHKSPFGESAASQTGLITFYFDKTERNRLDRQLRLAREALDHALDAYLLLDRVNGRILDVNERAISVLGYSRRELHLIDPAQIMPPLSGDKFRRLLAETAERSDGHSVVQTLIMKKDGSVFDAEIQFQVVQRGENDQIVAIVKDITLRVQSEMEMRRLNRTLKMLGSINRAIINAPNEDQLLSDACGKIISEGEYAAAHIIVRSDHNPRYSTVHRDDTSGSNLIASLDEIGFDHAEVEALLSLAIDRKRIRRAKPKMLVAHNALPTWAPPKYLSAIILPLAKTQTEGYILLFSKDENAFDDAEVDLLQELANETIYGVFSLRQEQARKAAECSIARRLKVETAISQFSKKLLASPDLATGLGQALPELLKASAADRVFICEILPDNTDPSLGGPVCAFAESGRDREFERTFPLARSLERWSEALRSRQAIDESFPELAGSEQGSLGLEPSPRLLAFPLFSGLEWVGLIGFVRSGACQVWESGSKEMMQIAAQLLGELIGRHQADKHQRMLMAAINNSDEGVVITCPGTNYFATRILFVNDGMCRMTGRRASDLLGASPAIFHAESSPREEALLSEVARGRGYAGQAHYLRADGSKFAAERSVYPIFDSEGKLVHYLSIQRDITEKKQLQSRLEFANKMESIGQLSAGIAHEINTPSQFIGDNLRFIQGAWESLAPLLAGIANPDAPVASAPPLPQKKLQRLLGIVPEAIRDACEGVERITTIVKAMREFSHPEKTFILGDINKCISTTVTVARNEWKYISDLTMDLQESLPLAEMMPGEINQVILNLIVNAAHAIEDQCKRTGSTKGSIRIASRQGDDCLRVSIADDGGGIPHAIRNSIFDPFFTTKEVGKGTGQGLFMAHSIIEKKHRGRLWFDSTPGEGTTFHFELPLPRSAPHERN